MLIRILEVVFPVFFLTALGWWVARRSRPDFGALNRLTMDVFTPALVFGALAGKDFHIVRYWPLVLGMLLATLVCMALAWLLARTLHQAPQTWVPPMSFGNSGNLGLSISVLAFGEAVLPAAVVMFMISSVLHFSIGTLMLDRQVRLGGLWRVPIVFAMLAGLLVSVLQLQVWPPAVTAFSMLGQIAIPLNILALGVRLADMEFSGWRDGVLGGLARPVIGMLSGWAVAYLLGLDHTWSALMILFGAMPPAVMNFIMAERYRQEPGRVAAIVLIGNLFAVVVLPLALAWVLPSP